MPIAAASSPSTYRLFAGVDSAAATFTAVWMAPGASPSRPLTLDQTPQGSQRWRAASAVPAMLPARSLS